MNSEQAKKLNKELPFTVSPCDLEQSFAYRSFPSMEAAKDYAKSQKHRPWAIVASGSGAVLDTSYAAHS
jgi:hypothetical protein